ncbi:potassium channel subfamily K member 17 [Electrophorus electricus]|uniref:potassium channel subfamily K member 17 n=1 Tax=Electrophorus electricus TaxID=8005 RepID=UPI0015D09DC0|nr:potassium channel subfamily K member 17 [Electrophorus electricus]
MVSIHNEKICTRQSVGKLLSVVLLGVVYMAYVLIGGVIFWKLEGDQMESQIALLKEERSILLQKYQCLDQNSLEELAELILSASKDGLSLKGNHTSGGFWKFTSSAVFAATVVTTIGYGNISPRTTLGQIFCVVFAVVGIPLNVVVLNRVGKYMLAVERKFCNIIAKKTNHQKCMIVCLHVTSFLISSVLYFVVPMLLFQEYEGWTYSQAIYYCFITLSTIGFGDYVADSNQDKEYPDWYGCILGVWIFFGLAWLALLINHAIDLLERINAYHKSGRKNHDETDHSQQREAEGS